MEELNLSAVEIARKPVSEVRNNATLTRLYIEKYEGVFFYKPNCIPCTFTSDFNKFKAVVLAPNFKEGESISLKPITTMAKHTLKREFANEILAYQKDGKTKRIYGKKVTDEFAEEFLKNGTKEQLAERKKFFEDAPDKGAKKSVTKDSGADVSKEPEVVADDVKAAQVAEELNTAPAEVKADALPKKKSGPKTEDKK